MLSKKGSFENYELSLAFRGATYVIVSSITKTVDRKVHLKKSEQRIVPFGTWVTSTSPARIDLSGAWTDTPPICSDFGGKVCGVAVQVDGKVRYFNFLKLNLHFQSNILS